MAVMTLPLGSVVKLNGNSLTEHNRQPISVDIERIETSSRMIDGTMRKNVVIDKRKWSTSWDNVPNTSAKTIDGKWGAKDILDFYLANPGSVTLTTIESGVAKTYTVFITSCDGQVKGRSGTLENWTLSLTLEEM